MILVEGTDSEELYYVSPAQLEHLQSVIDEKGLDISVQVKTVRRAATTEILTESGH